MPFIEPFYVPDAELDTWNISFNVDKILHHYHALPRKIERGLYPQKRSLH